MKVATCSGKNEELKRLRWINGAFGRRTLMGAIISGRRASGHQPNEHAEDDAPGD
jgi:hypothetical protein